MPQKPSYVLGHPPLIKKETEMKGNFGLYVVPTGPTMTDVFKIDYNSGKTWRFLGGCWVAVKET